MKKIIILLAVMLFLVSCAPVQEEVVVKKKFVVEKVNEVDKILKEVDEIIEEVEETIPTVVEEVVPEIVEEKTVVVETVDDSPIKIELLVTLSKAYDIILLRGTITNSGKEKIFIPFVRLNCYNKKGEMVSTEDALVGRSAYPVGDLEFEAQLKGETDNFDKCTAEVVK